MTSTPGRHDGDSWDLSRGVGATATAVATSRALATRAGLIDDQWAEPLVKAVGMEHFLAILDGRSDEDEAGVQRLANGMAARTRYFDEFLRDCAADGIRQIVILASGLDARAYRLPWPDGTVVFDLDQDAVIDFKVATLRALAAVPTADVRNVGVDLRDDWPAALAAQGFDRQARTAWIAEGLLMYLPPDAQDRLFDHITALSPAGSRLATEFVPCMDAFAGSDDDDTAQRWRRMGFKDDLAGLVYAGERSHVIEYLQALGWAVNGVLVNELLAEYGLEQQPDDMTEKFAGFQYISAKLGTVTARTDDDTWDLASSVGATATMVAAGRAMATRDARRLIDDPFAEPLVRAVGIPFFVDMIDGKLDTSPFGDAGADRVAAMIGGMAMRTKFFDDYFIDSAAAGIRQVVILAAGLDSRAYRLDWPSGTVVYEVDQPAVIEFKAATLSDLKASPIATLRTVGIDLREDWPTALRGAGFDPSAPTAWLAEGLLIYLPPEAQDRLLDTVTELSAPGSAVATESVPGLADYDAERAREMSANLRQRGLNLDMPSLIYPGPRNNVIDYLRSLGWDAAGVPGGELFRRNGLQPPDRGDYDPLGEIVYVSGGR